MGEGSRSTYHHGDLRAALIEAGLQITRAGGPAALRLREVTRQVGVTARAAYRHFADRDALLAAVAARIQDEMGRAMLDQMDARASDDRAAHAVAQLQAVGRGYVTFALDEPGWFQVAFFAPDGVQRPDGRVPPPLELLRQALDALVASGLLSAERRPAAEWSCWSTVHGFAEIAIHGPLRGHDPADVRALAAQAVDDVIAGILAGRRTSRHGPS